MPEGARPERARSSKRRLGPAALVLLLGAAAALSGAETGRRALVAGGALTGSGGQETLRALLPASGAVPGWNRDGDPQEFAGEDLYTYIDGGAEIYQEYGFRRVVVQDYRDAAGKSVSLEIFEMSDPAAAFGIYTFKRSGKGKSVPLGAGGDLEDYYLNFWKGRSLVTLTGFDEAPGTLAGLQALAGAVDAGIADKADPPAIVAALPPAGLKPGSVKYIRGLLGLNNVYSLYTARGLAFKEGVKGDYENGSSLIALEYAAKEACAAAWTELKASLDSTDRFEAAGPAAVYRDGKGKYIAFAPSGSRLLIGLGGSAAAALGMVR
ncbi:MAG: DUF6599 family protein [Acidobacteriota bacterium]